jgi:hypothetical protein
MHMKPKVVLRILALLTALEALGALLSVSLSVPHTLSPKTHLIPTTLILAGSTWRLSWRTSGLRGCCSCRHSYCGDSSAEDCFY